MLSPNKRQEGGIKRCSASVRLFAWPSSVSGSRRKFKFDRHVLHALQAHSQKGRRQTWVNVPVSVGKKIMYSQYLHQSVYKVHIFPIHSVWKCTKMYHFHVKSILGGHHSPSPYPVAFGISVALLSSEMKSGLRLLSGDKCKRSCHFKVLKDHWLVTEPHEAETQNAT